MAEDVKAVAWMDESDGFGPVFETNPKWPETYPDRWTPLYPQQAIDALRAEVGRAVEVAQAGARLVEKAARQRDAAEARAERLAEAGRRVTAAFRALGETTAWTRAAEQARHECEAAMLALDAAIAQQQEPKS